MVRPDPNWYRHRWRKNSYLGGHDVSPNPYGLNEGDFDLGEPSAYRRIDDSWFEARNDMRIPDRGVNRGTYFGDRRADPVSLERPGSDDDLAVTPSWSHEINDTDLQLTLLETHDTWTVVNGYSGSAFRVEGFDLSDGSQVLQNEVDARVAAMADDVLLPPLAVQAYSALDYQVV